MREEWSQRRVDLEKKRFDNAPEKKLATSIRKQVSGKPTQGGRSKYWGLSTPRSLVVNMPVWRSSYS